MTMEEKGFVYTSDSHGFIHSMVDTDNNTIQLQAGEWTRTIVIITKQGIM